MSTSGTLRLGKAGVKKADDVAGAIGRYIEDFGSGGARAGDDADEAADVTPFWSTKTGKATAVTGTAGGLATTGVLGYKGLDTREAKHNADEAESLSEVDLSKIEAWRDRNKDKDEEKGGILETVRDLLGLESSMQAAMILVAVLIVAIYLMNQSANMPTVPFPVSAGGGQR